MLNRNRFKQTPSLQDQLLRDARKNRERAEQLPPGKERDSLLKNARQDEVMANISEWLTSSGLQQPE